METIKKKTTCSLCGETGHNKRSCPKKPIEDIAINDDMIEERIDISNTREILIDDLINNRMIYPTIYLNYGILENTYVSKKK